jgi:asparagine synthase (glutamine-hydrolysing)
MCGLCGQLRFDNQAVVQTDLQAMMQKIARRGPDDNGVWLDKTMGFGHQRLSIIDLSNHAHQPMVDENLGLVLVFNGTIYNYQLLRTDLTKQGYKFFSTSDTEVILKAYHCWGEDCVTHLDGMFAFCIWNGKKLFVARDRMGIKPLYFNLSNHTFSFASNTQALLNQSKTSEYFDALLRAIILSTTKNLTHLVATHQSAHPLLTFFYQRH